MSRAIFRHYASLRALGMTPAHAYLIACEYVATRGDAHGAQE